MRSSRIGIAFMLPAILLISVAVIYLTSSGPGQVKVSTTKLATAAPGAILFQPIVPTGNKLVTNEYAYWNPTSASSVRSSDWELTSGSLFSQNNKFYTGRLDDGTPDRLSARATHSAQFRLNTRDYSFHNVKVSTDLTVLGLSSTRSTPARAYDGVHIWLRYKTQFNLYIASVARRDGHVVIKKKCPGGISNGGTYYPLTAEKAGYLVPLNRVTKVAASVRDNSNGTVTITLYRNGAPALTAVDTGVGCAPLRGDGAVGIRGDNTRFMFNKFTVTAM